MMKRSAYLKNLFDDYNSGKISEEAYDAALENIDAFSEPDEEEEDFE